MLERRTHGFIRPAPRLQAALATCESEIVEAQKLRYRVFAEELGARLPTRTPGVDRDLYDPWCEHLIVRDEREGRIVGTYRILSPESARILGGYYSENKFDLTLGQGLPAILAKPQIVAKVVCCAPIRTGGGMHRREIAQVTRQHIDSTL